MTQNITVQDGTAHHANFLTTIQGLLATLGPVATALIPGAGPIVLGAQAVESIAAAFMGDAPSALASAGTLSLNPAPVAAVDPALLGTDSPVNLPEVAEPPVPTPGPNSATAEVLDMAALAAATIAEPTNPEDLILRIRKLEADVALFIQDVEPVIALFKGKASGIAAFFAKLGL
jgi:hypothetical protein